MIPGSALLTSARPIAVAALAIGLLDQWLFVDTGIGINVPIFFAAFSLPSPLSSRAERAVENWTTRLVLDEPSRAWQAWKLSRERARDVKVPNALPSLWSLSARPARPVASVRPIPHSRSLHA